MAATSIGTPSGPFEAIRMGWGLYGRARSVFAWQVFLWILCLVAMVVVLWVVAGPPFAQLHGKQAFGAMIRHMTSTRRFVEVSFFVAIPFVLLQIGLMHTFARVIMDQRVQVSNLFWGFKRGEAWLLAIAVEVVVFSVQQINRHFVQGSMHATGNPMHPMAFSHPGTVALITLGFFAASLIYNDIIFLALAMGARAVPAYAAIRAALKAFRRGSRRFLLLQAAWMLVIFVAAIVCAVVAGIIVVVAGLFGPGVHAIILLLLGLAGAVLAIVLFFMLFLAMPASFVVASFAMQP